jgi:hypothetical protein
MKKVVLILSLSLLIVVGSLRLTGCATAPPSPPKPGVPRISGLVVPKIVSLGQPFPISFQFEDSEADITTVVLTYEWGPTGSESHSYDARIFGEASGTCKTKGFAGKLPDIFYLSVYVKDTKGNRSNILRTSIFTK